MNSQNFKRNEVKYLINQDIMNKIIEYFGDNLQYDKHNIINNKVEEYPIYSIYFDTKNNDVIRYSTSHPIYKEKLRIRSYKINLNKDDVVYIELKRKYNKMGYKRRLSIPYSKYMDFIKGNNNPYQIGTPEYIVAEEIKNHLKIYQDEPHIMITAYRMAYYLKDDPDFRITFDTKVYYRYNNLDFKETNQSKDKTLLNKNEVIMEIKFLTSLPIEFTHLLSSFNLSPRGYSKYGKIYQKQLGEETHA